MSANTNAILQVTDLKKHFPIRKGVLKRTVGHVHAVNGVSFAIRPGESLGLVGESGCGKTTLGKCVVFLQRPTEGTVVFKGTDLGRIPEQEHPLSHVLTHDFGQALNPRAALRVPLDLTDGARGERSGEQQNQGSGDERPPSRGAPVKRHRPLDGQDDHCGFPMTYGRKRDVTGGTGPIRTRDAVPPSGSGCATNDPG